MVRRIIKIYCNYNCLFFLELILEVLSIVILFIKLLNRFVMSFIGISK